MTTVQGRKTAWRSAPGTTMYQLIAVAPRSVLKSNFVDWPLSDLWHQHIYVYVRAKQSPARMHVVGLSVPCTIQCEPAIQRRWSEGVFGLQHLIRSKRAAERADVHTHELHAPMGRRRPDSYADGCGVVFTWTWMDNSGAGACVRVCGRACRNCSRPHCAAIACTFSVRLCSRASPSRHLESDAQNRFRCHRSRRSKCQSAQSSLCWHSHTYLIKSITG